MHTWHVGSQLISELGAQFRPLAAKTIPHFWRIIQFFLLGRYQAAAFQSLKGHDRVISGPKHLKITN